MNILIMTVGLPRSGKSTWAAQQGYPIVNPDSIRLVLHGTAHRAEAEPMVWAIAKTMVHSLFLAGHKFVILDATNLTSHRRLEWKSKNWKRVYKPFTTDMATCIERAIKTEQKYLVDVIKRMDSQREPIDQFEWDIDEGVLDGR